MSFAERLGLALAALRGGKTVYDLRPTWSGSAALYPKADFANAIQAGYRRNELIYACVKRKADSAAQTALRVRSKRTGEELPDHPLRQLIARPNPEMSEFDFHVATQVYLDAVGLAYWEKVRSRAGAVAQLWPLRPDWVVPIPGDGGKMVRGYEYRVPGVYPVPKLKVDDVLAFRLFDPLNVYGGLGPIQVAMRVGLVDSQMTDHVRNTMEHGGVPLGVLTTKQKLWDESEVERIRKRWRERYGGWENWSDPAVLDSEATFEKIGFSFTELGFDVLDARSEARICMVLQVPPILVGAKVGLDRSTFSNFAEAREAFWQETLIPQYKRNADRVQASLADEWGDVEVFWDFSEVPALQEDETLLWTRARDALHTGAVTVNEYREMLGLEMVGSGDVFLRPTGVVVVGLDGEPLTPAVDEAEDEDADKPDAADEGDEGDDGEDGEDTGAKSLRVIPDGAEEPLAAVPFEVGVSEGDERRALALWDALMAEFAGLLDAEITNRQYVEAAENELSRKAGEAPELGWRWDDRAKRYRAPNGRFIAAPKLVEIRDTFTGKLSERAGDLARALTDGDMSLGRWHEAMRDLVKHAYYDQYALARGGRGKMTPADRGRVGALVKQQYGYLRAFAEDIAAGKLTPAQIAARAKLYMAGGTQAYERSMAHDHGLLDGYELPAYPGDGSTVCKVNCKCHWEIKEYKNRWEAWWRLGAAEHCPDCVERSQTWAPYKVMRGAEP